MKLLLPGIQDSDTPSKGDLLEAYLLPHLDPKLKSQLRQRNLTAFRKYIWTRIIKD
jgi:hypothetical protein